MLPKKEVRKWKELFEMQFSAIIVVILLSHITDITMFNVSAAIVPWTEDTIIWDGAMWTVVRGLENYQKLQREPQISGMEVAMKITNELWYGNVSPFEQCTRWDTQLKELLSLMARNRDELEETLTEKQKETLEKFEENMNEMHGIAERDAFSYGFRLGVQLMAEAFFQPLCDDWKETEDEKSSVFFLWWVYKTKNFFI